MVTKQPAGAPIVERVAGWSARHRKIVVVGWLLLVAATFTLGQRLGTANTSSYDPGQAGQAERVLASPVVPQYTTETVLIQARSPGRAFRDDPEAVQAAAQLVTALRGLPRSVTGIRSPLGSAGLVHGGSALVTFSVPGERCRLVAGRLWVVFPQGPQPVLGCPAGGVGRINDDDRQVRVGGHLNHRRSPCR